MVESASSTDKEPQDDLFTRSFIEYSQDMNTFRDQILGAPGKSKQKAESIQKLFANVFKDLKNIQKELDNVKAEISKHMISEKDNPDGIVLPFVTLKMEKLLTLDLG